MTRGGFLSLWPKAIGRHNFFFFAKTRPSVSFVSGREPSSGPTASSDCLWIALVDDFRARKGRSNTVVAFFSLFACHLSPVRTHQKTLFCSIRWETDRKGGALKPHHTAPSSGRKAKPIKALLTVLRHRGVLSESSSLTHVSATALVKNESVVGRHRQTATGGPYAVC